MEINGRVGVSAVKQYTVPFPPPSVVVVIRRVVRRGNRRVRKLNRSLLGRLSPGLPQVPCVALAAIGCTKLNKEPFTRGSGSRREWEKRERRERDKRERREREERERERERESKLHM